LTSSSGESAIASSQTSVPSVQIIECSGGISAPPRHKSQRALEPIKNRGDWTGRLRCSVRPRPISRTTPAGGPPDPCDPASCGFGDGLTLLKANSSQPNVREPIVVRQKAVKCRFLPIFLSTRRLARHEEMGDAARRRRNANCRRPSKCQATVPVCEILRPQTGSKRDNLERAGKVQRTRRLTSRKLRPDPLSGRSTLTAVKRRSRHTPAPRGAHPPSEFLSTRAE
jgi:hypothetical protein